jgi:hypothetical protein
MRGVYEGMSVAHTFTAPDREEGVYYASNTYLHSIRQPHRLVNEQELMMFR